MQSETAKIRLFVIALMNLSFMVLGSNAAAQQSIEDNVRPAGQVCLAGQPCVGSTAGGRCGTLSYFDQGLRRQESTSWSGRTTARLRASTVR